MALMTGIGPYRRTIEVEPFPETAPAEPAPAQEPVKEPAKEPVPA